MYDVYLSGNDLLVLPSGHRIPSETRGAWRKKRRVVRTVSEAIRDDILRLGYHRRTRSKPSSTTPN